jgi:flagellum-specific ATP synthase
VIESISRLMPLVVSDEHARAAATLRRVLSSWARSEDLVRIGAYKAGTDPDIDRALRFRPAIRNYLVQSAREPETLVDARNQLLRLAASLEGSSA